MKQTCTSSHPSDNEKNFIVHFFKKSILISLLLFLSISLIAQNQQNEENNSIEILPLDPKLRFGRLDNGLTYYIRHNEAQKGRADFYLVHNVGSMQEEDNQRGYAHFLEHMALRSSKNFPEKSGIKGYTESRDLKTELYTSFDESVYSILDVPSNNQGIIDSCLLILHDWTSFLLLESDAIGEERNAVRAEWRVKHTPMIRLLEKQLPVMYPNTKYGTRLPVGIIGIIENFQRKDFLDFYKKWYVTDLQAVIIVGDIDVDKIEEKIKITFSDISNDKDLQLKEFYIVADNDFPIVSITTEKEEENTTLTIYYKHETLPFRLKGTIADFISNYSREILCQVVNERLKARLKAPNTPIITASASNRNYYISKTKDSWTLSCKLKQNDIAGAMRVLIEETEKLRKSGITEIEYERAKEKIFKAYETALNNRDKYPNNKLANNYINHFLNGDYTPGIEIEYEMMHKIASIFEVEIINNYIRSIFKEHNYSKNIIITLTGPNDDKIIYPTDEELIKIYIDACDEIVRENYEEINNTILIPELPAPGKIIEENENEILGTTNYKLSNGIQVIVKKTKLKKNQILMSAISPGGTSQFKDEKDILNLKMINTSIKFSDLGEFKATTLNRYLDFNKVSYKAGLTESSEVINGEATPETLKTLFEVIYLQFVGINANYDAFSAAKQGITTQLETQNKNLSTIFNDSVFSIAFNKNPRTNRLKANDLELIDYNRIIAMYKDRFADASDFVFTFVGDIDQQAIRALIEQYLATLPSLNRKEEPNESQIVPFQKGTIVKHFSQDTIESVSKSALLYTGKMPYNLKNLIISQYINNILELTFYEKLLPYGSVITNLFTGVELYDFPEGRTSIQIFIESSPDTQNKIIEIVKGEITKLTNEGPNESVFIRSLNAILKKRYEILETNDYWLNIISAYYSNNFDSHTDYEQILKSITQEDIKAFTKEFINQGNVIEVVMNAK